jgi:hypothetical protein
MPFDGRQSGFARKSPGAASARRYPGWLRQGLLDFQQVPKFKGSWLSLAAVVRVRFLNPPGPFVPFRTQRWLSICGAYLPNVAV